MKLETGGVPTRLRRRAPRRQRRGAMLVLIGLMLVVFLTAAVFSVDLAYMQLVRTELRAATDAAAKAGVEALARQQTPDAAVDAALDIAGRNLVAGRPLALAREDVLVGRGMQQRDGSWSFTSGAARPNAVRVSARMSADTPTGAVNLFFGRVFGRNLIEPENHTTAAHYDQELCLAIDRSHSMCFDLSGVNWSYPPGTPSDPHPVAYPPDPDHSRWAALEGAVDLFLDIAEQLHNRPQISLVTWGSKITLDHFEGQLTGREFNAADVDVPMGNDYQAVRQVIHDRGRGVMLGATNMTAGMDAAIDVLTAPSTRPLAKKTMILMTDGQWNQGRDPRLAAEDARSAGIVVHTITFLPDADQQEMREVAKLTGGRHYHAHDEATLRDAFRELALTLPIVLIE